jgi:subtilisin family serine protease
MRVLDSMGESDAKLVEMTDAERVQLRAEEPGLRVVRVVDVRLLWMRDRLRSSIASASSTSPKHEFEVTVTDSVSGRPVKGAQVIAFTNRKDAIGQQNKSNAKGVAKFRLPLSIKKVDTVLVDALHTYWPMHRSPVELEGLSKLEVALLPLEIPFLDCRRFFNGDGADTNGAGVRVAVIDSGIEKHKDLVFTGKMNTARGEKPTETGDNGLGHGTHVAGIIAGRAKKNEGIRGVAPGVALFGYRVFAKGAETAESFAIAKAIRQAADDGCHLINLSLGDRSEMPDVLREIRRARHGCPLHRRCWQRSSPARQLPGRLPGSNRSRRYGSEGLLSKARRAGTRSGQASGQGQ